jgi:hypothetical protein
MIELGHGDTVGKGGKDDGAYIYAFCALEKPKEPMQVATPEEMKNAEPYFVLRFTNPQSIKALIQNLRVVYQYAAKDEKEAHHD